jgi:hypothetical protein
MRTAPFTVVSVQVGLRSPALMLMLPMPWLEAKEKQVLPQPASEIPKEDNARKSTFTK